jgi:hypothetical protein
LPGLAWDGVPETGPAGPEPAWLADVRLRTLRRVMWLRECWGRSGYGDESAMAISHSEVDRALTRPAALAAEEQAFYRRDRTAASLSAVLDSLAARPAAGDPWQHLVTCLELTAPEANLLALALAAEAVPALRRVYGYLQDETGGSEATPGLAACLWSWPHGTSLGPAEALRRWHLARPAPQGGWPGSVQCEWQADPALLGYLLQHQAGGLLPDQAGDLLPDQAGGLVPDQAGGLVPGQVGGGQAGRLVTPPEGAPVLAVAQLSELVTFLTAMWDGAASGDRRIAVEVEITGPAGAGRAVLAAQAAAAAGLPLLALDTGNPDGGDILPAAARLARSARLSGAAVIWRDADQLDPSVLAAVSGLAPVSFLTTGTRQAARTDGRSVRWSVTMPPLDRASRLRLWTAVGGPGAAPEPVAEWPLRPGEIAVLARAAPAGPAAAAQVARSLLLPLGQDQVTAMPLPYDWPDLVVPAQVGEHLGEIAEQARARGQVLDDWGLRRLTPMGGGLTALFAGPSGTGKTMAAQVLARSLGLELLSVDLAGVVSKYIGETEKQLRALFDACERAPAVLFFDEADALFGRRTQVSDAHDRFANIEIDYLLQRMERFNGLAVLASNRKGDLDEAFVRRLRFIVDFVPPGPAEREQLWRLALGSGIASAGGQPVLTGELDFGALARELDLTGAGIKSAALAAAFLARTDGSPIGMPHVRAAARRELAKQGVVLRPGTERP